MFVLSWLCFHCVVLIRYSCLCNPFFLVCNNQWNKGVYGPKNSLGTAYLWELTFCLFISTFEFDSHLSSHSWIQVFIRPVHCNFQFGSSCALLHWLCVCCIKHHCFVLLCSIAILNVLVIQCTCCTVYDRCAYFHCA